MQLTIQTLSPSEPAVHPLLTRLMIFVAMSYVFVSPICEAKNIQNIDNKQSDAKVVALNLTYLCLDEYEALIKIAAQYDFDTDNERRMFTVDRNADYSKIDASLPIGNMNR